MYYKISVVLIFVLITNACGFQLRGSSKANLNDTYFLLEINSESVAFEKVLKRNLISSGAKLVADPQSESLKTQLLEKGFQYWRLKIIETKYSMQGISRDQSGRSNENQLRLKVDFVLEKSQSIKTAQQIESTQAKSIQVESTQTNTQSISETASYYQDYRDSSGQRVQEKETRQLLIEKTIQKLIRILRYQIIQSKTVQAQITMSETQSS